VLDRLLVLVRSGEHREDAAAYSSGTHSRQIEVAARPARRQQRVIIPRQGIVVPVEHRQHVG
jgi:hypothetical protein